jgi:predicted Zn finger-like uncharacterized protein
MKFVCDSCHAQYMISDDKVGANGVKVRCKKCSNIIVVKKAAAEPDPTMVMKNPLANAPGDSPFGDLDLGEIGAAFDNVLSASGQQARPTTGSNERTELELPRGNSGDFPMAAGSSDSDRDSTRVMDLKAMAGLTAQPSASEDRTSLNDFPDAIKAQGFQDGKAKADANGHANGNSGGVLPTTDWYAAIDEEQKGPMTLDELKGHWEAGKVSPDSLVWRNGYSDWKPLSTVGDLVKVLTPIPTPRKAPTKKADDGNAPAGAVATGSQTPFVAPAPAAVPDPDEVDWKPAAASALASLVADEMEALSKPPVPAPKPRAEPVGVGEGTNTGLKPLLDVAPPPASDPAIPVAPRARPVSSDIEGIPAARRSLPPAEPQPEVLRRSSYPSAPDVPVYPAPAAYVPPAQQSSNAKYIALGGGFVVFCLTALGITYVVTHKSDAVETTRPAQVAVAQLDPPVAPKVIAPTPVPPATSPVATQPAPTAATQPAAVPAAAVAHPVAPTPTPAPAAAVAAAPVPKAAAPAPAPEPTPRYQRGKHGGRQQVAMANPAAAEPEVVQKPAAPARASSDGDLLGGGGHSKIDDDFEKALGGGGGSKAEEAPTPAPKKKGGSSVYIPPAVNQNLPEQLGQGDIMGVVAGHKDQIKNCIQQQRAKDPDSSGTVKMHWVIQKAGNVGGIAVGSDEFKGSPMGSCMGKAIASWRFPQFSGPPMPIDFPFKF